MVPGIVVEDNPCRVLIRGIGPELVTSFGFAADDVLPDPTVTLKDRRGESVAFNDDWAAAPDAAALATVAEQVGAFPLSADGKDSALLVMLEPGSYTVFVSDSGGREGIAMVEVYAAP
jgi:hypothetical protein